MKLYAGLWRRLIAGVVDHLILTVIFFLYFLALIIAGIAGTMARGWDVELELFFAQVGMAFGLFHLWCLITWFAYFTCFYGWVGQTPGKMLLGLKVYLSSGRELTIPIAFLRTAGYLLSTAVAFLGFLWIMVDRKKRGWHDLVAGTVVVRERKTP